MNNELLISILIVCAIVALGLFTFNQVIGWKYKAQILMGPCQLCVKLNPEVAGCWQIKPVIGSYTIRNDTISNLNLSKF